jgi:hypothetical protein
MASNPIHVNNLFQQNQLGNPYVIEEEEKSQILSGGEAQEMLNDSNPSQEQKENIFALPESKGNT